MANKGQFQKGNRAAKKKHKSTFTISNNVSSTTLPTENKSIDTLVYDYMPFGANNLFPQNITEINRRSAIARAVIKSKALYITGQGFETENTRFANWKPNNEEELTSILAKLSIDSLNTGNAYFEVVKTGNDINIFHKDSTTVRIDKTNKYAIIHPDWERYTQNPNKAINIPLFPDFAPINGFQRSIVHIKDYESEFGFYGVPSNIGGVDSVNINSKTNKWNLSRVENGFNISGILSLEADFSDEDAQTFDEQFNDKFVGEAKAGKVLKIINEVGNETNNSKFIPIASTEDGSWGQLHEQATSEIVIANGWFRSLSALQTSTGFDTDRIRQEYQIAMATVIPTSQKPFIDAFQKVLNDVLNFGIDDLKIINTSPVDLVELTNVHTAIIEINKEVSEGRMSVEMAKMTMKFSFGLNDEEVNQLFI